VAGGEGREGRRARRWLLTSRRVKLIYALDAPTKPPPVFRRPSRAPSIERGLILPGCARELCLISNSRNPDAASPQPNARTRNTSPYRDPIRADSSELDAAGNFGPGINFDHRSLMRASSIFRKLIFLMK